MRFFAAMIFISCSAHPRETWDDHYKVFHAPKNASFSHRAQVENGLNFIKIHAPYLQNTYITWDGDNQYIDSNIRLTKGAGGQSISKNNKDQYYCAITCGTDYNLSECIAHEFGHCAGMEHTVTDGLMNPILPPTLVWTDSDEEECKKDCK